MTNIKETLQKHKTKIIVATSAIAVAGLTGALVLVTRDLKLTEKLLLSYDKAADAAGLTLDVVAETLVKIPK